MRQTIFSSFILLSCFGLAQTGKRTVTGMVTSLDDAMPLENVGVWVKGTGNSSGTQADGIYYISVSATDSVLVFAASDFEQQEVRITTSSEYDVKLHKKTAGSFSPFGTWRGVFQLNPETAVPFNFQITGKTPADAKVFFINGDEKFAAGGLREKDDSIFILTSPFDNELAFRINGNTLEGVLRKQDRSGMDIALKAEKSNDRFVTTDTAPLKNISGTYAVTFKNAKGADEKAVGLFTQEEHHLKATFLRITGDSRYLDGIVEGNKFYLSSFIGSSPIYYSGTIAENGTLAGNGIYPRGKEAFEANPDENAALPDAYKLTLLKDGYTTLDFAFPDINGKTISLKDQQFKNKVVILAIEGTWCPNCIDETAFLAPWYKANKQRGVEVIAIHYERQQDTASLRKAFNRFHQRFDIDYDEVIGGVADKQKVAESLPALNTFLAFPTTIFIDRQGKVSKIYTGFTGPATGKHYEEFVKEFNSTVDRLLTQ